MALQSMGRQGGGNSMAVGGGGSSSIALLQERFRQLEKMREKREEMELLKLFPGSETASQTQTNHYEQPERLLVHPEMIFDKPTKKTTPTRSSLQDPLSLGLDLYTKRTEPKKPAKNPSFMEFWSVDSTSVHAYDKPEVDTSLHL